MEEAQKMQKKEHNKAIIEIGINDDNNKQKKQHMILRKADKLSILSAGWIKV